MTILRSLKNKLRTLLIGHVKNFSYAQAGDDIILSFLFRNKLDKKEKGFYVDVGAYHPIKDSNTYFFSRLGWNGINIDATPGSMQAFKRVRPQDVNLETGVTSTDGTMDYYWLAADSTMNSFSKKNLEDNGMIKEVKKIIPVKTQPLEKILSQHQKHFTDIDILNIDVEGMDLEVLRSNDWKRFRPLVISLELNIETVDDLMTNPSAMFLKSMDYKCVAKNIIRKDVATVFFVRGDFNY